MIGMAQNKPAESITLFTPSRPFQNMTITPLPIQGAYIVEQPAVQDHRGRFTRFFCAERLAEPLCGRQIMQINHSFTVKTGAIRGLHFQRAPHAEMKIIRCLSGRVFDVAVDLRKGSLTFLKWVSVELTPTAHQAIIIPEGCAHGFQTLEANCELLYLHTAFYNKAAEGGLRYNDPALSIKWPLPATDLSARDQGFELFNITSF
jgi:dTDP-4-dehydrorhamnose 3,5-epimerase